MQSFTQFFAPILSFAVAWPVAGFFSTHRIGKIALDIPNERSLHERPKPRLGGAAVAAGIAVGWLLLRQVEFYRVGVPAAALMLISLVDDVRGLPIWIRLPAHFLAALALLFVLDLQLPVAYWLILLPAVVWAINLYNFMDGSDGLAGGMAVIGFGGYALAAWMHGDSSLSAASACVALSSLAFLFFNFHPARLFLGDSGAIPLGFLMAGLGLVGWQRGDWNAVFPLLMFSPFIADASVTLAKRIVGGERFWQAHRGHYYQRLARSGLGHSGTCQVGYALMAGAAATAFWANSGPRADLLPILIWLGWLAGAMLWFDLRSR